MEIYVVLDWYGEHDSELIYVGTDLDKVTELRLEDKTSSREVQIWVDGIKVK